MFVEQRIRLLEMRVARLEGRAQLKLAPALALFDHVEAIVQFVADQVGLDARLIKSRLRNLHIQRARHSSIWLTSRLTLASSIQIGRAIGRDHVTVLNSIRAVEHARDTEPSFRAQTDAWLAELSPKPLQ